ncbi:unnamed protein product [marine sediment metagenome]|uniref:Cytosolic protein n=1 Tax=marine sediment metagenome TaxID=412755 RepID=X1AS50_9ZZZZ
MKKMIECNQETRKKACAYSYDCERRGKCCECLEHHLSKNQLPGCAFAKFSKEAEKSYNRDFEYFAKLVVNN